MKYGVLVREALEERKQKREAFRKKILTEVFKGLGRLSEQVTFDEAFVFGSLMQPYAFYDKSDIDIGFVNLPDDRFFFTIAFLSGHLGRDVDVVQLETAGRIRSKILKEGIRWTKRKLVS